ncbi:MAG: TraG family conjugative transposon ATPase [Flavobacteriaceae bacterium]|nr:TraG family conjugative transposon ATPase [Flavobacteriaceae bacterium]MCY4268454.1 TraG family conjugative transposon ATPase [Flavobacteriaceae bacterium]
MAKKFELPFIGVSETGTIPTLFHSMGDFSAIISCRNPIIQYSGNQNSYYDFIDDLTSAIKTLGPGFIFQKTDVFCHSIFKSQNHDEYLTQQFFNHFDGRSHRKIQTFITITKEVQRGSFFKWNENSYRDFVARVLKVMHVLESKGWSVQLMNQSQIDTIIKRFVGFDFADKRIAIKNIHAHKSHLTFDDKVLKSISLVDIDQVNFPGQIKPIAQQQIGFAFPEDLMSFLFRVPELETLVYNQIIMIPSQRKEIMRLEAKKRRHSSIPDPANNLATADIEEVLTMIAKDNDLLVYTHYGLLLYGQQIEKAQNFIETQLFSFGVTPSSANENQLELYLAAFPGNANTLKRYDKFLMTLEPALCLLYKETLQESESSDFKIYLVDRYGIPLAIDTSDQPMETGRINNRNKFVLGPSGSGKSFFMNHMVKQYADQKTDIVLVDTGGSYWGLCHYVDGKYITYSEENPITMNPFAMTEKEYNEEKRDFLKSLVGILWKGVDGHLSQMEESMLIEVISNYYECWWSQESKISELSFNSFYEFSIHELQSIQSQHDVQINIKEYAFILKKFYKGGPYETILNASMDASLFDETFIVFEIDNIKDNKLLFPITTIIIMDVFLQKMRLKKGRKALIIEEAWKAISSPMMAGYILYVYKTVRKFWGEAIVVTQELEDIISNEIVKKSIINNSDTVILLDQSKFMDSYQQIAELLNINQIEQKKIFTINKLDNKTNRGRFKEVYIKRGTYGEVFGIEVSLHEYLIYTTERKEKEAIQLYVDHYGNYRLGLDRFVEDFEKSQCPLNDFVQQVHQTFSQMVVA